ncbi:UNVERIFIED_CONTAM: hypothetical protein Sradi_2659400 [Sesamum radiatum]|uniref:Integrase catalytic domain-containing protein n=1 Tax=Sesamum radiatum TaxID=300843 RepID=A0AAW2S7W5_SESRA
MALPRKFSAPSLVAIFVVEVYCFNDLSKSIASDRDPCFLSTFWRKLFHLSGTSLAYNNSYHPQTNGQTKVVNCVRESYLHYFVSEEPHLWFCYLHLAEFWYHSFHLSSIGMTPHQALYGIHPPSPLAYVADSTPMASSDVTLSQRQSTLSMLCYHLTRARLQMKQQVDHHRRDLNFAVGDGSSSDYSPIASSLFIGVSPKNCVAGTMAL